MKNNIYQKSVKVLILGVLGLLLFSCDNVKKEENQEESIDTVTPLEKSLYLIASKTEALWSYIETKPKKKNSLLAFTV